MTKLRTPEEIIQEMVLNGQPFYELNILGSDLIKIAEFL